ncbi:MAG TPA: hypothetical protein PKV83_04880 [Methanothrix sp.]|nr:hypothetical protein [Methanothrix sp.]
MCVLFCLTYDIWNEIVDDVVGAYVDLFEAMHRASEQLQLSKPLIDDLKSRGMKEIGTGPESLLLKIDLLEDKIGGFRIYLMAAEDVEVFEELKAEVASDHGFCIEEIEGFELEHGLDMDEEIFEEMKESYGVDVEIDEDKLLFSLVVFDSQDIDDSRKIDDAWEGNSQAN